MKQYVYYLGTPCVFTAFGGKQFELKKGDIITKTVMVITGLARMYS